MTKQKWIVEEDVNIRIDKYLSDITEHSRTRIQDLADNNLILVNDKPVKSSYKVVLSDVITCDIPELEEMTIEKENIPLDILYEDSDIIVINKLKGMVVHPAPGNYSNTLVNALLYHCEDLSGINGVMRPGIVHRLDKDTTGCIVACKNDKAHRSISEQLSTKTCKRTYLTIVKGVIEHNNGVINAPIGRDPNNRQKMKVTDKNSKEAITNFRVLERFKDSTYVECELETGRTHQIRVHMKYINHPVLGDDKYGSIFKPIETNGQVLHASSLKLIHPTTNEEMVFNAPLPEYFEDVLEYLRNS